MEGQLSLDDPIGGYLDGTWATADVRVKVKVKHLLTHASGLGSYFDDAFFKSSRALSRKVDDDKPLVRDATPRTRVSGALRARVRPPV